MTTRISLPAAFKEQMAVILGDGLEDFLNSYHSPRTFGLRLNTGKVAADSTVFDQIREQFGLTPIPWCPTGYYYREESRPGRHPYHHAGVYYLQEPSAMSSAELLAPQAGETVLDLAAAPGGKSTRLAELIGPEGLLVANEIHGGRSLILSENIERMGMRNTIVVNEPPDRLSLRFPHFFDRIMLDAPCSGEGMFRKDPEAIREWSPDHVTMCAARQLDIIGYAVAMLKPGGVLGYSTCTFNRQENEELIAAVLARYPGMSLSRCERIWPHLQQGEGHYVAVLQMEGEADGGLSSSIGVSPNSAHRGNDGSSPVHRAKPARPKGPSQPAQAAWDQFQGFATQAGLRLDGFLPEGAPVLFGDQLYWLPAGRGGAFHSGLLDGIRSPRPGLHLATVKKNRIEPAHALALALPARAFPYRADFPADAPATAAYLRGEAISAPEDAPDGWLPVCTGGFALGWTKASGGQLKNHYPKGLRRL